MLFELIIKASFVVQLIMLILLLMSVYSIYIIVDAYSDFKRIDSEINVYKSFVENEKNNKSGVLITFVGRFKHTVLSKIFLRPFDFLETVGVLSGKCLVKKFDKSISLFNDKVDDNIVYVKNSMENKVKILATISSISPYIGLLGTVIGIMNSFMAISEMKSVGLEYLAPSIAEALIVTGMGLFVAIPSNVFFNKLMFKIDEYNQFFINLKNGVINNFNEENLIK